MPRTTGHTPALHHHRQPHRHYHHYQQHNHIFIDYQSSSYYSHHYHLDHQYSDWSMLDSTQFCRWAQILDIWVRSLIFSEVNKAQHELQPFIEGLSVWWPEWMVSLPPYCQIFRIVGFVDPSLPICHEARWVFHKLAGPALVKRRTGGNLGLKKRRTSLPRTSTRLVHPAPCICHNCNLVSGDKF